MRTETQVLDCPHCKGSIAVILDTTALGGEMYVRHDAPDGCNNVVLIKWTKLIVATSHIPKVEEKP